MTESTATTTTRHKTRDSQSRKKVWRPPRSLEAPQAPPGYKYRWVRKSIHGEDDNENIRKRTREFYEPVQVSEISDADRYGHVEEGKHAGTVSVGDLILMKVPDEVVEQRQEYYEKRTSDQQKAVDEQLDQNANEHMPLQRNNKSKVSRGRGARFQ
jgi:hypothetical protein